MFYIQTNEVLVEAPGLKRYIMVVVGLHEMMVDVNGNFGSFIVSAT